MTQVSGIDYAFSPHPSISAIQAGGFHYVARYISRLPMNDHNGKNLLVGELGALLDNGIRVVVVAEEGASRMLGGRSAGVTDAKHANAVVKALDMPSIPIYFAADWDATPGQQKAINAYLDGAASVVTRARVGIYGGLHVVRRAYEAGKCTWIWQTLAWSGGQWYAHSHIRQVHNGIRVGGASCDLDLAMATDYGQWPRPRAPVAPPVPDPAPGSKRHWRAWKTEGKSSLQDVSRHTGTAVPTLLRHTIQHYGKLDKVLYAHVRDVFAGKTSVDANIPKGARIWVHSRD
jgi:hypothetical protein